MKKIITSDYALNAQTVLWEVGVSSRVCGYGDPPIVPWEDENWTLERISKSDLESIIKIPIIRRKVIQNIEELEKAGFEYADILIAHEKKRLLPFQIGEGLVQIVKRVIAPLAIATVALAVILAGALALLLMAGVAIAMSSVLYLMLGDPVVILVLKDGSWLEIARWDE